MSRGVSKYCICQRNNALGNALYNFSASKSLHSHRWRYCSGAAASVVLQKHLLSECRDTNPYDNKLEVPLPRIQQASLGGVFRGLLCLLIQTSAPRSLMLHVKGSKQASTPSGPASMHIPSLNL